MMDGSVRVVLHEWVRWLAEYYPSEDVLQLLTYAERVFSREILLSYQCQVFGQQP